MARKPKAPAVAFTPRPPGTVLLCRTLLVRAVPWSASTVVRRGAFKNPRLVEFQRMIAAFAADPDRQDRAPYLGPVELHVSASFARGPLPDCTNILKSVEDALQGVVYANDRQVGANSCARRLADRDELTIVVVAA